MVWFKFSDKSRPRRTLSLGATLFAAALLAAACSGDGADSVGGKTPSVDAKDCPAGVDFFQRSIYEPILSQQCIVCHTANGMAKDSRMILTPPSDPDHMIKNFDVLRTVAKIDEDNKPLLLQKPTGEHKGGHTGGIVVPRDSANFASLQRFVAAVREGSECDEGSGACQGARAGRRRLRRLTRAEYDLTVKDLLGTQASYGASFSADAVVGNFDNNGDALAVAPLLATQLREAAEALSAEAVTNLASFAGCTPSDDDEEKACAAAFIKDFGARAFRRPVTEDEQSRYAALCELVRTEDGFGRCIELVVQAMLQSPHFLYRTELGENSSDEQYELSDYEIASELSYFLWSTMPDAELFAAAAAGDLKDSTKLVAQTERMLASPKAEPMIRHFSEQWLGVDRVLVKAKDDQTYPMFPASLRTAMLEETKRFVTHVLTGKAGKVEDLFSADYSFMNAELAAHYGLAAPASDWDKVSLDGKERRGLLSHASVLTTWALPGGSSPIHRGIFVRQQLFCQPLPMPPPAVNLQPPAPEPGQTTRERFIAHVNDEVCSSCHNLIDPIGFAFEHYDGIGRYRDKEQGKAIDATGEITTTNFSNGKVDGAIELADTLKSSADVRACFAKQWFRYAYGVEENAALSCLMDDIVVDFRDGDGGFKGLVLALVQSEHFRLRRDTDPPSGQDLGAVSGEPPPNYPGGGSGGGGSTSPGISHEPAGTLSIQTSEDNWGSGYCMQVNFTNISDKPVAWTITVPAPGTVNNVYSAKYTLENGNLIATPPDWGPELAAGASQNFGFCAEL